MSVSQFTPMDHDLPLEEGSIRLASGRYINLLNPKQEDIYDEDIAHALSHLCRFGGHTARFYSVAEHSLHVAAVLLRQHGDQELAVKGLLHDAAEAYLGDVVRPLKRSAEMAPYRDIEARMEAAIAASFGLDSLTDGRVKQADSDILAWEMAIFRDSHWRTPTPPEHVRYAFIEMLDQLLDVEPQS